MPMQEKTNRLLSAFDTESVQRGSLRQLSAERKAELGQFMTPPGIARFMVSLFPRSVLPVCRLLDAGAGEGSLSCAFLDGWKAGDFDFRQVDVTAYEIDPRFFRLLNENFQRHQNVNARVISGDYIELGTTGSDLLSKDREQELYTHAILNPPYRKINSHSQHRYALRRAGIETVNLYSAFVALALSQLVQGGQLVAIIPRSFCNGSYYRKFREFIFTHAALQHLHLFTSRNQAFKTDAVLQENVIIRLERGGRQGAVKVSHSWDGSFSDFSTHDCPFETIVTERQGERFIHVPLCGEQRPIERLPQVRFSLADIGLQVSTGAVVDFRLKEHLRNCPEEGSVPLIYPLNLCMNGTVWPVTGSKKASAIMCNPATQRWLYPNGFYCAVRRLSSKEEKRRVVAGVIDPEAFPCYPVLGFENHINVFHENKKGLPEMLARGLAVFLNASAVDDEFRRFNGHTQVNATDLRQIKYPSRSILMQLGLWAKQKQNITEQQIDNKLEALTA